MQLTISLSQGLRHYWSYVTGFGYNARLFLWSSLLSGVTFAISGLLLNFYLVSLGYRQDFLGLMASLTQLTTLIASLPAAMLSDAIGRKAALVWGAIITALAVLGLVVFTSTEGLIAMGVLYGIGTAIPIVVAAPFMMENSRPDERTHLFSISFALQSAAGFAGGLMGGNLPEWLGGLFNVSARDARAYQAALVVAAVVAAATLVPLARLRSDPTAVRRTIRRPLTGVRAEGRLLFKLLFPNLLISLGAGLLIPFANVFLRELYGVSDSEVGGLFSLAALVAGVAIALGPVLAQRFGKIRAVVGAQALSVPCLLIMGFSPIFPLAFVAFLSRAALMQMSGPIFNAYSMEVVQDETRATVSSLTSMVWTLGWVVSPIVSGQMQVRYGWLPIIIMMAALYVAGIGLTHIYFGRSSVRVYAPEPP